MTAATGAPAAPARGATERFVDARVAKGDRDRGIVCRQSSAGMSFATWDVRRGAVGATTIATNESVGFTAWLSADGRALFRLAEDSGNEHGHVERLSLDAAGEGLDLTPDLAPYALRGGDSSLDGSTVVFAPVNADGFMLASGPSSGASPARIVYRTPNEAWNPRISADSRLAVIDTTDHNPGVRRFGVSAFDLSTSARLAVHVEPSGGSATAVCFSPVPGDPRVLISIAAEPGGFARPALWNPLTDLLTTLKTPWDAADVEIVAFDWSAEGSCVLLGIQHYATQTLAVHDLGTGATTELDLPAMSYWLPVERQPSFGSGGSVLAPAEDADTPVTVLRWRRRDGVATLLRSAPARPGSKARSVTFESSDGTVVQAWLIAPAGDGPHPAIVHVHGGPHWFEPDCYNPDAQTWADHGFAHLEVNYRGSTGRGSAFAQQVWGNVGHFELEDLAAAHRWLVASGIAIPGSIFLSGGSYGGFLTLYGLGRQPGLWAGGFASVAIGDWALAYRDASAALRAAFRTWFGGTPDEKPDGYRDSSAITYAASIQAPLVVVQGTNDSRTPPAQMRAYTERLRQLGKDITIEWFDAGHQGLAGTELGARALGTFVATARSVLGEPHRAATTE
jgi:dipeptidyl aminopeptidase/acylaminoacyl peptidase